MIDIASLMRTMSRYLDTQRELAQCRAGADGDADYYSYSYRLAAEQAEQALANALNGYIDQRVAEELRQLALVSV
jgi:hypothetical protein